MIRIPLEKAYNVRDLGGYAAEGGAVTKSGVFLRGGGITGLTKADINTLTAYGVRTVIDLRGREESLARPNAFAASKKARLVRIGLLDGIDPRLMPEESGEGDYFGTLYIVLLVYGKYNLARVFKTLAATEGCTLFHCTAGKDRTGVTAALLLDLAGVHRDDIIANYEVTHTYIKDRLAEIIGGTPAVNTALGRSDPRSMALFLDYLYETYGGGAAYLSQIGVTDEEIAALKGRFIGHPPMFETKKRANARF